MSSIPQIPQIPQKLKCVDVFTGIAGVSLALSPFVDTVLYCEINGYCQEVLGQLMKNGKIDRAPVHGNIKTLHLDNTV